MALTFGFASCESKTAQNVENTADEVANDAENAFDEVKAEADSISLDSIEVRDEPVKDGVADKIEKQ